MTDGGGGDAGSREGAVGGDEAGAGAGDASADATPVASCGGQRCQSGQTCVAGSCTLDGCTGTHVPGDYGTVQAAVDALSATGGTICLGAGDFGDLDASPTAPVTIQGLSAAQTTLHLVQIACSPTCTLRGISVTAALELSSGAADGTILLSESRTLWGIIVSNGGDGGGAHTNVTVGIDACDISAPGSDPGIDLEPNGAAVTLRLTNSYVHDSGGVSGLSAHSIGSVTNVFVYNDTFVHNDTALVLEGAVEVFDNVIADNALGISLQATTSGAQQLFGANALFGNTTNYAGSAVDGPGYVKSDPMLDSSTPPGLRPGSPCIGAGDAAHAPALDFWGAPRGAHPDIGAVQSP